LIVKASLIFRKRFTVLNYLFLHPRLWESATSRHWNLLVAWIYRRRSPNFGIRLPESARHWPNSDDIIGFRSYWLESGNFCHNSADKSLAENWPIRQESGQIRLDSDETGRILAVLVSFRLVWPESGSSDSGSDCRIPFYIISDFFVRVKHWKIFSEKSLYVILNSCRQKEKLECYLI
jgi:hypothetical protein